MPPYCRSLSNSTSLAYLRGLRSFYIALGAFALATLFSLLGSVVAPLGYIFGVRLLEVAGVIAGILAVAALVSGSVLLLRETRIAVEVLSQRAADLRTRAES